MREESEGRKITESQSQEKRWFQKESEIDQVRVY